MSGNAVELLRVEGLTKAFSGTIALDEVGFDLRAGEIHGLIGENGAGKSTLIKILTGVYACDRGSFLRKGRETAPGLDSLSISVVHQDMGLVNDMTVAENIALTAGYARRGGFIDWPATRARARETLARLGLELSPDLLVGALATAEKALVAIARALSVNADILILDEPSAALPEADVERVALALERLRESGIGIIYITHRLDEIFRLADRVTVFRDGRNVATLDVAGTDVDTLIERMVGRPVARGVPPAQGARTGPLLSLRGVWVEGVGPASFDVHAGEIVGLVGLAGAGHHKVGRAIYGALPLQAGSIFLEGRETRPGDIAGAIAQGIGFVAGDRAGESILPDMSVRENLYPNRIAMDGPLTPLNAAAEREAAMRALDRFDVRPRDARRAIATLSGGNQQKVVLARRFQLGFRLLVLEEPTAGVDVGARSDIYEILRDAVAGGSSVLMASSDFAEVEQLCHRAIVFNRGVMAGSLEGGDVTVQRLTQLASTGIEQAS